MDGKCAAFIVFERLVFNPEVAFIQMDYSAPPDLSQVITDEEVYIVDYSFFPDDMRRLLEITNNVTWIDHHKSAIERYVDFPTEIMGIREEGNKSGALLAWEFFHPDTMPPLWLSLVSDWDTWTFAYNETEYFKSGMDAEDQDPRIGIWHKFSFYGTGCLEVKRIIQAGYGIVAYNKTRAKELVAEIGVGIIFEGHSAIVVNCPRTNSKWFDSVADKYDLYMPYYHNGKKFIVSIYTNNGEIDVSLIAKKYNGGGHPKAAGFSCDTLPWE